MARNPNSDIYQRFPSPKGYNQAINLAEAFEGCDITSTPMQMAIREWFGLYFNTHECCCDKDNGMRLPYSIVDTVTNATFGEFEYTVEDNAGHVAASLKNMDEVQDQVFQFALIGGECFIKPIPTEEGFTYRVVRRDAIIPLARNFKGELTSVGLVEYRQRLVGATLKYYTLCEKRSLDERGYLTIVYKLFESSTDTCNGGPLGDVVPLSTLQDYAALVPSFTFQQPMHSLGLIACKTPMVNCVDGSKEAVSLYAAAAEEIKCTYNHAERMNWEYEATRPKLVVVNDIVTMDKNGRVAKPTPDYIEAIDTTSTEGALSIYNPTPHQGELEARMNQHLRNIENLCGLRRGQFSNVDTEDKTATEILTSTARYALTIRSMQEMWEATMCEAIKTIAALGNIYFGWGYDLEKLPEVAMSWGNGVLYDEEKEYQRLYNAVLDGLVKPEFVVAWLLNKELDPTDTESVAAVRALMPDITNTESRNMVIG